MSESATYYSGRVSRRTIYNDSDAVQERILLTHPFQSRFVISDAANSQDATQTMQISKHESGKRRRRGGSHVLNKAAVLAVNKWVAVPFLKTFTKYHCIFCCIKSIAFWSSQVSGCLKLCHAVTLYLPCAFEFALRDLHPTCNTSSATQSPLSMKARAFYNLLNPALA